VTYHVPSRVPAWHVEIYWRSSIVGHLTGWLRPKDHKEERTFRTERAARAYAERKTGIPSLLVSYMSRKGIVVQTTRETDWRDSFRAAFNLRPIWQVGLAQ
jgi:hypothetical protein